MKIIGITEHKISCGKTLNGSLEGFNFVFDPVSSTHRDSGIFIANDILFIWRDNLKIDVYDDLESTFVEIIFPNKKT